MRAVIDSAGLVRKVATKAPRQVITSTDVQDPEKLARALQDARKELDALDRPRREMVYEDVATGAAGALLKLPHNFGARVRWHVVDWASTAGGAAPVLEKSTTTDDDTLVLASYVAGTASIRIEEAG